MNLGHTKIGIATVYTGYNYGSALQAFATKSVLESLGYDSELYYVGGSLIKGRDIRIKKLAVLFARTVWRPGVLKQTVGVYKNAPASQLTEASKSLFQMFYDITLQPQKVSYSNLRKRAHTNEFAAFVCGSDQIWNSTNYYVDPFYYLRFAPQEKRIAYAPSFGRNFVPDYNKKKIAKFISEFDSISVREDSGAEIVHELVEIMPPVLLDPTLLLTATQWVEKLNLIDESSKEKYILSYFLNTPSVKACAFLDELAQKTGYKIITIPTRQNSLNAPTIYCDAGPKEFISLLRNAAIVCTDSFHGTAFSINFHVPFYTFERNYGSGGNQSTRIQSLLCYMNMQDCYCPTNININEMLDFNASDVILQEKRKEAFEYLRQSIIKENEINI